MYNIMIVDDEIEILEGISRMVDWESYGFLVTAKATNGKEALDILRSQHIDLLMTDITMPSMDGLSLIRAARKSNPNMKSVLITCHSSFDYAREAIELGVVEYIVKHTIYKEQIIAVLEKVAQEVENDTVIKKRLKKAETSYRNNVKAIIQSFFDDIVIDGQLGHDQILDRARRRGVALPKAPLKVIGFYIDNFNTTIDKSTFKNKGLLRFSITNIIEESLSVDINYKYFWKGYSRLYLIVGEVNKLKTSAIEKKIKSAQANLRSFFGFPMSVCQSKIVKRYSDLVHQIKILENMREGYFYQGSGKYVMEKTPFREDVNEMIVNDIHHKFIKLLHTVDVGEAETFLIDTFDKMKNNSITPQVVKRLFTGLYSDLQAEANYQGVEIGCQFDIADTYDVMLGVLLKCTRGFLDAVNSKMTNMYRPEIIQVMKYIDAHMGEKITCEEMAHRLCMNRSYFSRMFKKETGSNFSNYVNQKRIDYALSLLKETDNTIEEISLRIGFENVQNFSRMIKKQIGKSPNQLRK